MIKSLLPAISQDNNILPKSRKWCVYLEVDNREASPISAEALNNPIPTFLNFVGWHISFVEASNFSTASNDQTNF